MRCPECHRAVAALRWPWMFVGGCMGIALNLLVDVGIVLWRHL